MSRPRKPYKIYQNSYTYKSKKRLCSEWYIGIRDHLGVVRTLAGTPNKSTCEYIAKNITAIVNLRICNQPLTADLRIFIESRPREMREELTKWGILDANTSAGFEPLVEGGEVKAKNSNRMKFDVTGGHVYHWKKSMEANESTPHHISESVANVVRVIKGCRFITPSDIDGEKFKNWRFDLSKQGIRATGKNPHE